MRQAEHWCEIGKDLRVILCSQIVKREPRLREREGQGEEDKDVTGRRGDKWRAERHFFNLRGYPEEAGDMIHHLTGQRNRTVMERVKDEEEEEGEEGRTNRWSVSTTGTPFSCSNHNITIYQYQCWFIPFILFFLIVKTRYQHYA